MINDDDDDGMHEALGITVEGEKPGRSDVHLLFAGMILAIRC